MVGIRAKLQHLAAGPTSMGAGDGPKFGSTSTSGIKERVSDWDSARLQRRLISMRAACQGKHTFNGPNKMALERLLERAGHQGEVMMVVMPVSPIYHKEFLTPRVMEDFEEELADLQLRVPQTKLVRLDHLPALEDNSMFYDFVHLNMYGQQIATAAFLNQLKKPSNLQ
jgi:hypothetical protein